MLFVAQTPPLPKPAGANSTFDNALVAALVQYLGVMAFRVNNLLPKDGSEPMEGNLDFGGFSITNLADVSGDDATFDTLRLTSTTGATPGSTSHAFQIGDTAGANLAASPNQLQGRNNGAAAGISINPSGGTVTIGALLSLSGGQIQFPATQNSSADSHTLDDYEENTWTPALAFGGASTGMTYLSRSGTYIKIGRLVIAEFAFVLSNKGSSTGNATITMPFSANSSQSSGALTSGSLTADSSQVTILSTSGSTNFTLWDAGTTISPTGPTGSRQMTHAWFTNSSVLQGSIVYITG